MQIFTCGDPNLKQVLGCEWTKCFNISLNLGSSLAVLQSGVFNAQFWQNLLVNHCPKLMAAKSTQLNQLLQAQLHQPNLFYLDDVPVGSTGEFFDETHLQSITGHVLFDLVYMFSLSNHSQEEFDWLSQHLLLLVNDRNKHLTPLMTARKNQIAPDSDLDDDERVWQATY